MPAKQTAIGTTPTLACTSASTRTNAMTQAASSVRTDSAREPGLDDLVGEPVERPGPTHAGNGPLRGGPAAPPDEEEPEAQREPQEQAGHVTPCARRADRS